MSTGELIEQRDRSICGLREAMFQTLDELRAGTTDANKAKAVVCVAQVILNSVQVQIGLARNKGIAKTQEASSLTALPDIKSNRRGARALS